MSDVAKGRIPLISKLISFIRPERSGFDKILMEIIKRSRVLVAKVEASIKSIRKGKDANDHFILAIIALNHCMLNTRSVILHVRILCDLYENKNVERLSDTLGMIQYEIDRLGTEVTHLRSITPPSQALTEIADSIETYHNESADILSRCRSISESLS